MTAAPGCNRFLRRRRLAAIADRLADTTGLCRAARLMTGCRLAPILCYHRLGPAGRPLCTPPDLFESHLRHLRRHYRPCSLEEIVGHLESGREPPAGSVAVTFDDGYRDVLDLAAPLLVQYGIPATFFVTVGFADRTEVPWWERVADALILSGERWKIALDGRDLEFPAGSGAAREYAFRTVTRRLAPLPPRDRNLELDRIDGGASPAALERLAGLTLEWEGIRSLQRQGFTIGCHGLTHEQFPPDAPELIAGELTSARDRLRQELGDVPLPLAFPYAFGPPPGVGLRRRLRELGFSCACTHASPSTRGADPFALGRLGVEAESPSHFAAKLAGLNLLLKGWRISPP